MGKGEGVPAACPERSHVVEFVAADAQEDGVLNAAPGGVPAHGEGGDDAVLRRGRRKKAAVDASPGKIKLTFSRGEGVVGRRHDQCREESGGEREGCGGRPV